MNDNPDEEDDHGTDEYFDEPKTRKRPITTIKGVPVLQGAPYCNWTTIKDEMATPPKVPTPRFVRRLSEKHRTLLGKASCVIVSPWRGTYRDIVFIGRVGEMHDFTKVQTLD